ncbi:MAG: hypothetical protein M3P51_08870 [Chloroflexota bacterium]|nr:hypothetical protein [Chloroflexota bacterium]
MKPPEDVLRLTPCMATNENPSILGLIHVEGGLVIIVRRAEGLPPFATVTETLK